MQADHPRVSGKGRRRPRARGGRRRAELEPAFLALFAGVPIDTVLRFLDGRSSTGDLLHVVAALPRGPFLRAAARLALGQPG